MTASEKPTAAEVAGGGLEREAESSVDEHAAILRTAAAMLREQARMLAAVTFDWEAMVRKRDAALARATRAEADLAKLITLHAAVYESAVSADARATRAEAELAETKRVLAAIDGAYDDPRALCEATIEQHGRTESALAGLVGAVRMRSRHRCAS